MYQETLCTHFYLNKKGQQMISNKKKTNNLTITSIKLYIILYDIIQRKKLRYVCILYNKKNVCKDW